MIKTINLNIFSVKLKILGQGSYNALLSCFDHGKFELEEDIIVFTNKPPYLFNTVVNKN